MTFTNHIHSPDQLPPKALARKIVDAAVKEAEEEADEEFGPFIHCDIGTVGYLNVVVTHNEMDGAQVGLWDSEERSWRAHPNFCLGLDDVSAMIQALLTAKSAIKMLNKERG